MRNIQNCCKTRKKVIYLSSSSVTSFIDFFYKKLLISTFCFMWCFSLQWSFVVFIGQIQQLTVKHTAQMRIKTLSTAKILFFCCLHQISGEICVFCALKGSSFTYFSFAQQKLMNTKFWYGCFYKFLLGAIHQNFSYRHSVTHTLTCVFYTSLSFLCGFGHISSYPETVPQTHRPPPIQWFTLFQVFFSSS